MQYSDYVSVCRDNSSTDVTGQCGAFLPFCGVGCVPLSPMSISLPLLEGGCVTHGKVDAASPGYASAEAEGVLCECTLSHSVGVYRYTFRKPGGSVVFLPLNSQLLSEKDGDGFKIELSCDGLVSASVTSKGGARLFFCVSCGGDTRPKRFFNEEGDTVGALFELPQATVTELRYSLSLKSPEDAKTCLLEEKRDFDSIRLSASDTWNRYLSRVEIDSNDPDEKQAFYTDLYFSLLKPCFLDDGFGDSSEGSRTVVGTQPLRSVYKTRLPMLFTLFGQEAESLLSGFLRFGELNESLPLYLNLNPGEPAKACCGRMICQHSIADAFFRGVRADYKALLNVMLKDMQRPEFADFFIGGGCARARDTLDMAEACGAMADLARQLGLTKTVALLSRYSKDFVKGFNKSTGLLLNRNEAHGEGSLSCNFRPLRHMGERIALMGEKSFAESLDSFFGFTSDGQCATFPVDWEADVPYAYCYTDRHSRLCELVSAMRSSRKIGAQGEQTSPRLWSRIGIFPISGQDLMLIGSPQFEKAVLRLHNGNTFTVKKSGRGIFVKSAFLDGAQLTSLSFPASVMMQGGELTVVCTEEI